MRERIFSSVLFPAPLRPIIPTTSPCLISKETSSRAQMQFDCRLRISDCGLEGPKGEGPSAKGRELGDNDDAASAFPLPLAKALRKRRNGAATVTGMRMPRHRCLLALCPSRLA